MKKLLYIVIPSLMAVAGCNDAVRFVDSEISAINRQSEVLREQNQILIRIANSLDRMNSTRGGAR